MEHLQLSGTTVPATTFMLHESIAGTPTGTVFDHWAFFGCCSGNACHVHVVSRWQERKVIKLGSFWENWKLPEKDRLSKESISEAMWTHRLSHPMFINFLCEGSGGSFRIHETLLPFCIYALIFLISKLHGFHHSLVVHHSILRQLRGYSVGLSYNFESPRVGNDAFHDAFVPRCTWKNREAEWDSCLKHLSKNMTFWYGYSCRGDSEASKCCWIYVYLLPGISSFFYIFSSYTISFDS